MTPADRGLQAERTALSWRRTALAVAVGSVVVAKVLAPHVGGLALALALLGLLWSADLALISRRQYQVGLYALSEPETQLGGAHILRTSVWLALTALAMMTLVLLLG